MIVLLSALATLAAGGADVALVDGGLCTGLAWVPVPVGAKVSRTEGPDFDVFYVDGPGDASFGVYSGGYPQVPADTGKPLLEVDGVSVRPAHVSGKFRGYVVGNSDYLKNHFFGTTFAGSDADLTFFKGVAFGKAAAAKCNNPTGAAK